MKRQAKAIVLAAAWMLAADRAGAQIPLTGSADRRPQTGIAEVRPLAEQYIDTRNGLSLADAIARAIDREPTLRAARAEIDVARGMRIQAGLRPNPTLSFERREEPAGTDNQTMMQVQWPLDLFRRPARVATADREVEATERSVDDRIRMLVADVRLRYGQAASAIREMTVAGDLATSMRSAFELLGRRVEEGAAPPLDRDIMDVELRRIESDRLLAAGRAAAAMFELRRAIGMSADTPLMLRDTLEALAPRPVPDAADQATAAAGVPVTPVSDIATDVAVHLAVDVAMVRQRADVREAEARVNVAESRLARARSESRFDVSLFGSYSRMDQGFSQMGFNANGGLDRVHGVFHYVSAGAMVTVPLGNRNQGGIAAARAEHVGAGARFDAVQLAAQAELAAAEAQDTQSRRALALIEGSVRLARQNLDVVRQTYALGRATVSDVLVEQRRYLDVERAYTETLKAAYEARTALQRARGDR